MGNLFKVEEGIGCQVWLERMPRQSNPAGEASRQVCKEFIDIRVDAACEAGGDSAAKDLPPIIKRKKTLAALR